MKEDSVYIRYQASRNLAINDAIRTVHNTIKIDMYSMAA